MAVKSSSSEPKEAENHMATPFQSCLTKVLWVGTLWGIFPLSRVTPDTPKTLIGEVSLSQETQFFLTSFKLLVSSS